MNNRIKNICILAILIIFLLIIWTIPVNCFFKQLTGISCPACGMTRAFYSILNFDFIAAIKYNILSIPFFFFIVISCTRLSYEILTNKFIYIPKLLKVLSDKYFISILLVFIIISFILNNILP